MYIRANRLSRLLLWCVLIHSTIPQVTVQSLIEVVSQLHPVQTTFNMDVLVKTKPQSSRIFVVVVIVGSVKNHSKFLN